MAKDYIIAKITAPRSRAIKKPDGSAGPRDEIGHQLTEPMEPAVSFQIVTRAQFAALKEARAKHGVTVEEAQ